ncbi:MULTISPECIES: DUF4188 domain-containing protein [Streptomyces]|nr:MULTISPECIES: DUF4188 domain-containing protein [Streptomyces]
MTAAHEGDITVFLIGMRINSFLRPRAWVPVATAMARMLAELRREPARGLLGFQQLLGGPRLAYLVQYWESHEQLLAYAADSEGEHRPAWAKFNRRMRSGGKAVGFWHETYVVPAGAHEQVYVNMPTFGLGEAGGVIPVGRRGQRAADRLSQLRQPGTDGIVTS